MTDQTTARLEAIRARLADITPGKWQWEDVQISGEVMPDLYDGLFAMNDRRTAGVSVLWVGNRDDGEPVHCEESDAAFIAAAPDDIAWLVAEVERWQARYVVVRDLLENCRDEARQRAEGNAHPADGTE